MPNKKMRQGTCAYCGAQGDVTDDHVVPKSFFGTPHPNNMPVVPACPNCNNKLKSADDQYVLHIFTADMRHAEHPVVQANFETMLRAAQKGYSTLARAIPQAQLTEFYSPGGLYLGRAYQVPVDQKRLQRFMRTTARGLYYYHFHHPLPADRRFTVKFWRDPDQMTYIVNGFLDAHAPYFTVGDGSVFEHMYWVSPDDPTIIPWLFNFYQHTYVTVATYSPTSVLPQSPVPARPTGAGDTAS